MNIIQIINEELQSINEDLNKISLQTAIDKHMFGPVYHGTTTENREKIEREGFKIFMGADRGENIRHGYPGERAYAHDVPPPIHHLGYGIYFTTVKEIAKRFNVDTTKGLKTYYLDVPKLETINFASPNRMMEWWIKNGYDPELAKNGQQGRIDATKKMTEILMKKYDAVWFKGKTMYRVLDGDQIVVFDTNKIYQIDSTLAKELEIGSKVERVEDKYEWKYTYDTATGEQSKELSTIPRIPKGTVGKIRNKKPIEPILYQWHNVAGHTEPHWAENSKYQWSKGGIEYNLLDKDIVPVNKQKMVAEIVNEEIEKFHNEGIADTYAEKQFHIPDPHSQMDIQAKAELQRNIEKPVGIVYDVPIFKNPKSLINFDEDVRAIADLDGNIYVAQKNGYYLHGNMAKILNFFPNELEIYHQESMKKYQLLHRIGSTDSFGLADTSKSFAYSMENINIISNILSAAKKRNPQFEFYNEYYKDVDKYK